LKTRTASYIHNISTMEQSNGITNCMYKIQHALKFHDVYKTNYDGLMKLPVVISLKRKNKMLRGHIKQMHKQMTEMQQAMLKAGVESVYIKTETPNKTGKSASSTKTAVIDLADDDDVQVVEERTDKPNIVYEIVDEHNEEEEEAAVVEEEEEEEEVVEEEEEEEVVEEEEEEVVEEEVVEEEEEEVVEEEVVDEEEVVVEEEVVEEEEEVVEEVVEEEVVEEEEEVVEEEVVEEEEEEDEEYFEVTIQGKKYCTPDETNGAIYSLTADGDIGEEVGRFNNGKAVFK